MRALSLLAIAGCLATPALAQERRGGVAVERTTLREAVLVLGRQTGASIGLRDPSLATIRVEPVRGQLSAGAALARMLRGTGLRARRVADNGWVIERMPAPHPRRSRPAPPPSSPAAAAEEPAPDIIVTASKRDTPLFAYAGAVTILDGAAVPLAEAGQGTDAIARASASLTSTHLGPGRNKLFIRGVADSSFTGPTQATVGQYWGDTRITYSAPDPSLRLYDVARVEVLEGPQGTLYGAGSLGGIVRVVPAAPDPGETAGAGWAAASVTQHGDPGGDAGLVANLPVARDTLALRVVGYGVVEGGYIDDRLRALSDVNRVETCGGRGALRWLPGSGWTIDMRGTWQRIEGRDAQYADRAGDGLSRASAVGQPYANDYLLGELALVKDWGALRLTSATGIVDQFVTERFDATPPGGVARAFTQESRIRMLTSETRLSWRGLGGEGWVLGASLLSNDARLNRRFGEVESAAPVTGVRNRVDEATLFGEATLVPAEWLALTGGGRLTHSRLSGFSEDIAPTIAFRYDPQGPARRRETRLLPSAAVVVQPSERWSLFLRYQEGFRPGGLSVNSDYIERFDGDRVTTLEAGVRLGAPGRDRFDFSATLARTWWDSIQADLIDGTGFPTTANIGDGRILSFGLRAGWEPAAGIALDGSLYLNRSEVTTPAPVLLAAFAGSHERAADSLPNVADVTARLGARYSAAVGRDETLSASAFVRYVGKSTLGVGPQLGQSQGDYADTGASVRIGNAARGLSLTVDNLFDARGNRFALGSPFLIGVREQITPLRPRTVRLGLDFSF